MQAKPTTFPMSKPELDVALLLYSPDEAHAQRFAMRMRALVELRWADSREKLANRALLEEQQARVLLLDFSKDCADHAADITRQLASVSPGIVLLGIGSASESRGAGVLAALRAGVTDFIDIDAADDELLALLRRALAQAKHAPAGDIPAASRGQLVVTCGVRPGVGSSTLVAHLGALAAATGKAQAESRDNRVLLLDLGHSRGDVALYLGVAGTFRFSDALRSAHRLDRTLVDTAVTRHASGASVLSHSRQVVDGAPDEGDVTALLERLLGMFDVVLCDLAVHALPHYARSLLPMADEIWLVSDLNVSSVVSLDACLVELERLRARDLRVSLVVNRHDDAYAVPAARLAERFRLPLLAALPERSRALGMSASRGALLHDISPRDRYIQALQPLLSRLRLKGRQMEASTGWKKLLNVIGGRPWKRR